LYVVPERIQPISARANPRVGLGLDRLKPRTILIFIFILCSCSILTSTPGTRIALHLFKKPSYRAAPRDDLRMRVVERIAMPRETMGREALDARAEGEEPYAVRAGIVQREAG
jgi:hypothetical protein